MPCLEARSLFRDPGSWLGVQGRNPSVRIPHVNEKWRDERLFDVEDVFHALSLKRWMGIGSEWNKQR
jgi:hypothetical protein